MATQAELEAELVELKAAISKVLSAQSIMSPNGAQMMRANLETLYKEKRSLEARITSSTNNSSKIRLVNFS